MFRNIRQSINQIVSFTGILQKWRKILHVTVWLFLHNNKIPKNSKLKLFCCCSLTKSYLTLCNLIDRSSPASSVLHYLLEFAQIHVHWVILFKHLILCCLLLLLPSIFPSIRVFSNEYSYKATPISHSLHTYPHHFIVTPNFIKCFLRAGRCSYFLVLFFMFNGNLRNNDDFVWTEFDEEYLHVPAQWLAKGLVKVKSLSRVRLFAIPWIAVYQASLSMGFSRQEYWSGVPFPSPGDHPDPGIEPRSPAL